MVVEQAKYADDKTSCALELAKQVDCWTQLNLRQKDSIVYCMNNVLQNTGSLSLVQGPPGCGKTRFIVALLKTLLLNQRQSKKRKKRQILVCAPSNKAICVVLEQVLFFEEGGRQRLKCALAGIEGRIEDSATIFESSSSVDSLLRSFEHPKSAIDVFAFRFSANMLRALNDLERYLRPLCDHIICLQCEYDEDGFKTAHCSHCSAKLVPMGKAAFLSSGTVSGHRASDLGYELKARYTGLMNIMTGVVPALVKHQINRSGNRHNTRPEIKAFAQNLRVVAKRIAIAVLLLTGDTELLCLIEAASECYKGKIFSEDAFSYNSVSKMPLEDEFSETAVLFQLNKIMYGVSELKYFLEPPNKKLYKIYNDNQREVDEAFVSAADVVFCTLGTSGSSCVRRRCDVDVMLIDEAAQASEADLIVSMDLLPNHCILVGDPSQLPAFISSVAAQQKGCGVSAMERLLDYCQYNHCFLDTQYRMHPDISAWPNKVFYNSRLLDSDHVLIRSNALLASVKRTFDVTRLPKWLSNRCAFLDMSDCTGERRWGTSYANYKEAIMIAKIVKHILVVCDMDVHKQLCVITFYVGQVKAINQSLQKIGLGGLNIRVLTVDSFQGM